MFDLDTTVRGFVFLNLTIVDFCLTDRILALCTHIRRPELNCTPSYQILTENNEYRISNMQMSQGGVQNLGYLQTVSFCRPNRIAKFEASIVNVEKRV